MSHELFSSEQIEAMKQLLKRIDGYKNAMVISQAAVEFSKSFHENPFVEMEKILRESNSDTYLIAVPFDSEMATKFSAKLPHSGSKEYPYYLWVGVNGLSEAQEKMNEIETNPEINLRDLKNTGLLAPRQGSWVAQMIQAPNN